jgi:hypothetical protein
MIETVARTASAARVAFMWFLAMDTNPLHSLLTKNDAMMTDR